MFPVISEEAYKALSEALGIAGLTLKHALETLVGLPLSRTGCDLWRTLARRRDWKN